MTELTIDSVHLKGPTYPIIVNFQNGYPNEDFENNCAVLQDKDGSRMIATELSGLVYAGKEVDEDLRQTFILARNRETGKVRLIEVGCAELKPVIKVDLDSTQPPETTTLELTRFHVATCPKRHMFDSQKYILEDETAPRVLPSVPVVPTEENWEDEATTTHKPDMSRRLGVLRPPSAGKPGWKASKTTARRLRRPSKIFVWGKCDSASIATLGHLRQWDKGDSGPIATVGQMRRWAKCDGVTIVTDTCDKCN